MARKYEWKQIWEAPGGRRYFQDGRTGAIAAADTSGFFPHQTDDGVLWLDRSCSLLAEWDAASKTNLLTVPVVNDAGEPSHMGAEIVEFLWLAFHLDWGIRVKGWGRGKHFELFVHAKASAVATIVSIGNGGFPT